MASHYADSVSHPLVWSNWIFIMAGQLMINRTDIRPGQTVDIVLEQDQGSSKFTRGVIRIF